MTDPTATTAALAAQAKHIAAQLGDLIETVGTLDTRANRSGRVLTVAVLGVLLDLFLSVAVVLTLTGQASTNERLQMEIDRQAQIRDEALCPLYSLFVGSYNPNSRAAGEDRQKYEDAFVTIRAAYAVLQCAGPVVPPPIPR